MQGAGKTSRPMWAVASNARPGQVHTTIFGLMVTRNMYRLYQAVRECVTSTYRERLEWMSTAVGQWPIW